MFWLIKYIVMNTVQRLNILSGIQSRGGFGWLNIYIVKYTSSYNKFVSFLVGRILRWRGGVDILVLCEVLHPSCTNLVELQSL